MPDSTFASIGLSADIVRVLTAQGIESPFQIQTRAIPAALSAATTCSPRRPTGSGKTLAFAIPIVERMQPGDGRPGALILVPTRELAVQVTEVIADLGKARGLKVASVYGGVPIPAQAAKAKAAHVLVATPGRLQDLMDRRLITLDAVTILVLDEADRMLDMGFKPQVDKILRRVSDDRQTMFFSATLDGAVGELARALHEPAGADRGRAAERAQARRDRPPVRLGHAGEQGRQARRAAPGGARPRPRLRHDLLRSVSTYCS